MRNSIVFGVSAAGLLLAVVSALIFSEQPKPSAPLFGPAVNPYARGIYAQGMIESEQSQGSNINIYPEVSGPITQVLVAEGQGVRAGDALLTIDDSVQSANSEQIKAQAEAALSTLNELKAQPRREALAVSAAQVDNARATLKSAADQLSKQEQSLQMDAHSVSEDAIDNARNAEKVAATNLLVVQRQFELTRAGAWSYDIQNQEHQYLALTKAYAAAASLLSKYTIRAPCDGVVLAVQAGRGSYVSAQGTYDTYTQAYVPLITMATPQGHLQVRAYIDEVLISRLPNPSSLKAQMSVRGTEIRIPLTFVRIRPYVSPKIELSDGRQERVDVRVLPVIFRFPNDPHLNLYPGQLVDVYVGE